MQAMLLAAGRGTRLRPLTEHVPKPIVPVANRPLAWFGLDVLADAGCRHVVANTHPHPDRVEETLSRWTPPGVEIAFSREAELLGTGGGIRAATARFADREQPFVVMNADILFAPPIEAALQKLTEAEAVAVMILREAPPGSGLDVVGIDEEGFVSELLGASTGAQTRRRLMFTGVHAMAPRALAALPVKGCVIRDTYRGWLGQDRVATVVSDTSWSDLGTIEDYHRANLDFARGIAGWNGLDPTDGHGNLVAPGSTVHPIASVNECVVGAGVSIDAGVSLSRCVVWPGTRVRTSQQDAILTPDHTVEVS